MSQLTIYDANKPGQLLLDTRDGGRIAAELDRAGVLFERWPATDAPAADASSEQIGVAYAADIERLQAQFGYRTWDVIAIHPEHPDKDAMRAKFLDEHTHSEDEVRFFVAGAGLFTLHIHDRIYATLCEAGDLISVPAGTRHWFDMGPNPRFTAIRLFDNTEGWIAHFTGDEIAARYPALEN